MFRWSSSKADVLLVGTLRSRVPGEAGLAKILVKRRGKLQRIGRDVGSLRFLPVAILSYST